MWFWRCHLAASFDEVHRKAFAALQWTKVWSATMGLGAFFSSFEGDGWCWVTRVLSPLLVGRDLPNVDFSVISYLKFDVICCTKMALMMWSYIYLDGFVGAEKQFSWKSRVAITTWKVYMFSSCYLTLGPGKKTHGVFAPHKGPKGKTHFVFQQTAGDFHCPTWRVVDLGGVSIVFCHEELPQLFWKGNWHL